MAVVDSRAYDNTLPGAPPVGVYNNVALPILGISIGYADVYGVNLPGQWVDLTGLPSGQYWLEVIADPYDRIEESNETNNTTRILVDLVIPDPLIHPGDYNDDGTVDAADYVVWRNTLGQTVPNYGQSNAALGTGADGDGDGVITDADYDVWRARFGETASGASLPAAGVPEPGSLAMAACRFPAAVSVSPGPTESLRLLFRRNSAKSVCGREVCLSCMSMTSGARRRGNAFCVRCLLVFPQS